MPSPQQQARERGEHCPTPYRADEATERGGHVRVVDEQGVTVARVYQQPHDTWSARDTAEFLAHAANLHAELAEFVRFADENWVAFDSPDRPYLEALRDKLGVPA